MFLHGQHADSLHKANIELKFLSRVFKFGIKGEQNKRPTARPLVSNNQFINPRFISPVENKTSLRTSHTSLLSRSME